MKVRRKGKLIEVDGEEHGTLVDEEEEVLEEAGVDETPLTQEEGDRTIRYEESGTPSYRAEQIRYEKETREMREGAAPPEEGVPQKGSREWIRQQEAERKARLQEEEARRRQEKIEHLKGKAEVQKEKTEIAKLRKQEVEAGGGGLGGLVKRTVKEARREANRPPRFKGKGRRDGEYQGRYGRGQRRRAVAQTGLYSVSGMRQLTVPGRGRQRITGQARPIGIMPLGVGVRPQGDSSLTHLRQLTTPSIHPNLRTTSTKVNMPQPLGLGINTKKIKGLGVESMQLGINTKKMKPMGLGINTKGHKPMNFKVGDSGLKSETGSRSIRASTYLQRGYKPIRMKPMRVKTPKRPKNKRYNSNLRNLLKRERIGV